MNDILTEEEIKQLKEYAKNNDGLSIAQMAKEKADNGCKIERVHTTRNYINVHKDLMKSPVKYKIKKGSKNKETQGKALFLYALGKIFNLPHDQFYMSVSGVTTKHKKRHCNPDALKMMNKIDKSIEDYRLENISRIPDEGIGARMTPSECEIKRGFDNNYLDNLFAEVSCIIEENDYSDEPLDTYDIIEEENMKYDDKDETVVLEKRFRIHYNE